MSAPVRIEAPSDAQLAYIASLIAQRNLAPLEAVASKQEASEIIGEILHGSYDPDQYAHPWGVPFQ